MVSKLSGFFSQYQVDIILRDAMYLLRDSSNIFKRFALRNLAIWENFEIFMQDKRSKNLKFDQLLLHYFL